jgi:hypothetical protein
MGIHIKTTDELWQEVKQLALYEPIVHNGLCLQRIGRFSREHTAMCMVLALNEALKITRKEHLNYVMTLTHAQEG